MAVSGAKPAQMEILWRIAATLAGRIEPAVAGHEYKTSDSGVFGENIVLTWA